MTVKFLTPGKCSHEFGGPLFWAIADTPYGRALFALLSGALIGLYFVESPCAKGRDDLFDQLQASFPRIEIRKNETALKRLVSISLKHMTGASKALPDLMLVGSEFRLKVWQALLLVKKGSVISYSDLARSIGESAVRAVASAVGANPISYFVPCHRVIAKSGSLGGYRWGLAMKEKMLALEGLCCRPQSETSVI